MPDVGDRETHGLRTLGNQTRKNWNRWGVINTDRALEERALGGALEERALEEWAMEEPALEGALEVQAGPGAFEGLGLECALGLGEPRTAVGLGEWRALEHRLPTKQTCDAVSHTTCSSESWLGSYIAATAPSLSIKLCANPASKWALFIKHSLTNTLDSGVPCSAAWWSALMAVAARSCSRSSQCVHGSVPPGEMAIYGVPLSFTSWKNLSKTCTNPEVRFLAQKYSVIRPNYLFTICSTWTHLL